MCGICGILHTNHQPVDESQLHRMAESLAHRGPNHQGVWRDGYVGLAHRRLSIIDLSDSGNQPMSNESGDICLIFNGEIYNFQSIRAELEQRGHRFHSNTDTEVILRLYEEKGVDCLQDLRGMFAFAIWDRPRQRLFIARDRVGKKPLKYYYDGQRFAFASELKALLTLPFVSREVDPLSIHHYLNYGYCPTPYTGFRGIQKLPAAHYLLLENGSLSTHRYWQLSYAEKEERSEEEWSRAIVEKLDECVRLRLISDVPLGVFLSGGLDSSAIAALAARNSSKPINTFSIGFSVEEYNELPQARKSAEMYNTNHHEFIVEPDNLLDTFQFLVRQYEEPYSDSSALPTYFLSKMTKQHVTVALNGDGGDENFAGYERYSVLDQFLARRKQLGMLKPFIKCLPEFLFPANIKRKIQAGKSLFDPNVLPFYLTFMTCFDSKRFLGYYGDEFRRQVGLVDPVQAMQPFFDCPQSGRDIIEKALYCDFNTYLPENLMVKIDIATMSQSMEGRSPLLDHEFLELTAKIPAELKLHNGIKKYIFKKAIRDLIPNEIIDLPKRGFGIPIHEWFLGELSGWAKDYLLGERFLKRGYFKREAVESLWNEHQRHKNKGFYLWNLLTLEEWHRQYID
ncbi:MAG: asparagine synthase (glutamine-hydrolyzing) [Candidatus Hinthialibacter antarcticus]|nr:asparagine synthase (glutamine-hydrolyzing) [Candidatus Hinthialibacter antarcticus]